MASIDRARATQPAAKQPADPDRAPRRDTLEPRDAQSDLLLLQRTLGNQALQRLVGASAAPGQSAEPHADETDLDITPEDEEGTRSEPALRRSETLVAPPAPSVRPAPRRDADPAPRPTRDAAPAPAPTTRDVTRGAGLRTAAATQTTPSDHDTAAPAAPAPTVQTSSPSTRPTPSPAVPAAGPQPAPADSTSGAATPGPSVASVPGQVRSAADHDAGRRPADQATDTPATADRPAGHLVNDDGALATERGQMRKGDFLTALRAGVLTTAEAALAGTGHSAQECPWIEHWFEYYHQQDARHVERAIHKYAPETLRATTADEYIPHITERVRRALGTWVRTGQVSGVPDGVPTTLPEQAGMTGGMPAGLRFKSREGGPRAAGGVHEIRAQLGAGRSLDSQTQGRMEATFGTSLSDVRVHTDGQATRLADRMNAHAFAVGEHIAFAGGEYQPGTLIGDALIAHELAHVVQQRGADPDAASSSTDQNAAMEQDADTAAAGAVSSLWLGGRAAMGALTRQAMPRLRSGLGLSRCAGSSKFPSYSEIVADPDVKAKIDAAWASTEAAANETGRREEGFWIRLNTGTKKYEFTATVLGPTVGPADTGSVDIGSRPADTPDPAGTIYSVADFHTHTPTAFRLVGRGVGPSKSDHDTNIRDDIPGVVYDYVESPSGSESVPAAHPIGSAAQTYHAGNDRRQKE